MEGVLSRSTGKLDSQIMTETFSLIDPTFNLISFATCYFLNALPNNLINYENLIFYS